MRAYEIIIISDEYQITKSKQKEKIYNPRLFRDMLWVKWAETTYFEIYKSKRFKKLLVLFGLPINYWKELIVIKNGRKTNSK